MRRPASPTALHGFDCAVLPHEPWKNGSGTTRTIAQQPAGSGHAPRDGFARRASITRIAQDGAFSHHPGVQRTMVLLDGAGVHLVAARAGLDAQLTTRLQTLQSDGADAPHCRLPHGPCEVFNVMTRGPVRAATVRILQGQRDPQRWPPAWAGLLLALQGRWGVAPTRPRRGRSLCRCHIHVAEQTREVRDCLAWSGQRPVDGLLDHAPVDARWCRVHATHLTATESARAAARGAVAGLCPSTEANLGDGLFELPRGRNDGGVWGIGSDSHVCVNAAEELMLLEYGLRASRQERLVLSTEQEPDVAAATALQACAGGAQAAARPVAGLVAGQRADWVVPDPQHVTLAGLSAPDMLSAHIFASHRANAVRDVWLGGQQRVSQGRHRLHEAAAAAFARERAALLVRR